MVPTKINLQRLLLTFVFLLTSNLFVFSQTNPCEGLTEDDCMEFHQNGDSDFGIPRSQPTQFISPSSTGDKLNACASTFTMATPYNTNNGQRGCMFDVTATNTVSINCFDVNLYAGTTANYEIWYRPSSHVGFENNSAGWTQLGAVTGITSAGNNLPTAIPITFNVTIPAGQTYSFYVTNDFGGGTSYTDGIAVGNFLASDANITVFEGVGKSYPFGLTFNVRNFNGTIFYSGGALDARELSLTARPAIGGVLLGWATDHPAEIVNAVIERSVNGVDFELLKQIDPADQNNHWTDEAIPAGRDLSYRLQYTDIDGATHYSEIKEVAASELDKFHELFVYPQPFSNQFTAEFVSPGKGNWSVEIRDLQGKLLQSDSFYTDAAGPVSRQYDTSSLKAGIYLLSFIGSQGRQTKRISKL